jgi:hypothetical protein
MIFDTAVGASISISLIIYCIYSQMRWPAPFLCSTAAADAAISHVPGWRYFDIGFIGLMKRAML